MIDVSVRLGDWQQHYADQWIRAREAPWLGDRFAGARVFQFVDGFSWRVFWPSSQTIYCQGAGVSNLEEAQRAADDALLELLRLPLRRVEALVREVCASAPRSVAAVWVRPDGLELVVAGRSDACGAIDFKHELDLRATAIDPRVDVRFFHHTGPPGERAYSVGPDWILAWARDGAAEPEPARVSAREAVRRVLDDGPLCERELFDRVRGVCGVLPEDLGDVLDEMVEFGEVATESCGHLQEDYYSLKESP